MLSVEEIWRRYDADEVRLTAHVSQRMVALARLTPGMSVLDIATGRGEPAIAAAKAVAPGGRVVGIDISESMLAMARSRADSEGVHNLELVTCDAQSLDCLAEMQFDVVLARWGLMYMSDPVQALSRAAERCKSNRRCVAAMWADPSRVDYVSVPRELLAKHVSLPEVSSGGPGTFRYANSATIEADFRAAGWRIESIDEVYTPVMEAYSASEMIHWCECFGMSRLMEGLPAQIKAAWRQDMEAQFALLRDKDAVVRLGGVTRLVSAT